MKISNAGVLSCSLCLSLLLATACHDSTDRTDASASPGLDTGQEGDAAASPDSRAVTDVVQLQDTQIADPDTGLEDTGLEDTGLGDVGPTPTDAVSTDLLADTAVPPSPCAPATSCSVDAECTGAEKCIGTQCVGPMPIGPFVLGGDIGLLANISLPAAGEVCCEDVDGDGVIDNQLADVANLSVAVADQVKKYLQAATSAGHFKYLLDIKGAPASGCGPVDVAIYTVDDDADEDGLPDAPLAEQLAGNGVFQVTPDSLRPDGYGAVVQFNGATLENGVITSAPMTFPFDFVLPDGSVITAPIENAVIQVTLGGFGATGVGKPGSGATSYASFGGYVRLANVIAALNEQAKSCSCAGVFTGKPMATWKITGGKFMGQCEQQPPTSAYNCPVGTPDICKNLTASCSAALLIGAYADVSTGEQGTDGTTAMDAVSFGLYFDLAAAGLAPANVAPSFVAVGDTWEIQNALVIAANSPAVEIAVLSNDTYDPAAAPVITGVTQGSLGSTVAVDPSGTFLHYAPKLLTDGIETFTYTIQDAAGGQTSTATVTTKLVTITSLKPNCIDYCNAAQLACTGPHAQYLGFADCYGHCITNSKMPLGQAGDTSGNTIGCRNWYADKVNSGLSGPAIDCPIVGPTGGGVCGSYCDVYCDLQALNCFLYDTPQACQDACAPLSKAGQPNAVDGDTVQCRITYAADAATAPNQCLDAVVEGNQVCVASCNDQIQDGGEKGVDCGSVCGVGCPIGTPCEVFTDCETEICAAGSNTCVDCSADNDCPPSPNECLVASCTGSVCGFTGAGAGSSVSINTPNGDCQKMVCDGSGGTISADDPTDLPIGVPVCFVASCAGSPLAPGLTPESTGVSCTDPNNPAAALCGDSALPGTCVQCNTPSDCPAATDECHVVTCADHVCGTSFKGPEHTLSTNLQNADCQKLVCDGAGGTTSADDSNDPPASDSGCNTGTCAGIPLAPGQAPFPAGEACSDPQDASKLVCGDVGMAGSCVQCNVTADCPVSLDECLVASCTNYVCGTTPVGVEHTLSTNLQNGDCQKLVCDGTGGITSVDDPTDVPTAASECSTGICAGAPLAPIQDPVAPGTACADPQDTSKTLCGDTTMAGSCVQCNAATDCPPSQNECLVVTCSNHVCGTTPLGAEHTVSSNTQNGDCQKLVCDGAGGITNADDPSDLPPSASACTTGACTGAPLAPTQSPVTAGEPCSDPQDATKVMCGDAAASGTCVQCNAATSCATAVEPCTGATCENHVCGTTFFGNEVTVFDAPGNCHKVVCDGAGGQTLVAQPNDLPTGGQTVGLPSDVSCFGVFCIGPNPAVGPTLQGAPCNFDNVDYLCGGGANLGYCQMCNTAADCAAYSLYSSGCQVATCQQGQCFPAPQSCSVAGTPCVNGYECASAVCDQGTCAP
ncbi:MAG: hypothetical protein ACI9OJ_001093 [Myxococcota bacterium]|jgi:hypothetical protein